MKIKTISACCLLALVVLSYPGRVLASNIAAAPNGGIWFASGKPYNGATDLGSISGSDIRSSIAAIPGRNGFWVIKNTGEVYARGGAPLICGKNDGENLSKCSSYKGNNSSKGIIGLAAKSDGQGFWAMDFDGHVFTAGTAKSYGDFTKEVTLIVKPTEIRATPSGNGYYAFFDNGSVATRGDAKFFGPTGNKQSGIVSADLSLDASGQVDGYWLFDKKGGVYSYGSAVPHGSTGGRGPASNCWSIVTLPDARGYAWRCIPDSGDQLTFSRTLQRARWESMEAEIFISVLNESTDPGSLLVVAPKDAAADRESTQWDIYPLDGKEDLTDGGLVQLVNVKSRMCMNVSGSNYHELIQYPCQPSGGNLLNDRWKLQKSLWGWVLHPLSDQDWILAPGGKNGGDRVVLLQAKPGADPAWEVHPVGESTVEDGRDPRFCSRQQREERWFRIRR